MALRHVFLVIVLFVSVASSASVVGSWHKTHDARKARTTRLIKDSTVGIGRAVPYGVRQVEADPLGGPLAESGDEDEEEQGDGEDPTGESVGTDNTLDGATEGSAEDGATADQPSADGPAGEPEAGYTGDDPLLAPPEEGDGAENEETGVEEGTQGTETGEGAGEVGTGDVTSATGDGLGAEEGEEGESSDDSTDAQTGAEGVDSTDDATVSGQTAENGDGSTDVAEGEAPSEDTDGTGAVSSEDGTATSGEGESDVTGDDSKSSPRSDEKVPETPTAGNETAAFLSFELNQVEEIDDANSGFQMVPIFQNGSLVGKFAESPTIANFDALDDDEDDRTWYNDGPYADRITFQYIFTPESTDYADLKPKLWMEEPEAGIEPIVENESLDMGAGVGGFTLLYRCEPGGRERNRIALHLPITKSHNLDTMWVKVCGRGRFEHMHFGFIAGDDKLKEFNADGTFGTEEKHILEVGPTQLSTVLSVELEQPAWQLQFNTPYLTSDSDLVSVSLRETVVGGTLNVDIARKFSILYSCDQNSARANIDFTFAIPPWDNVTASWRKTCGGTHSQGLLIGTSGSGSYEVMQDGELNEKYNVTEETSLERAYGVIEEIDGKTKSTRFYIKNSDDAADLYIQTIALTMSNPDVLRAVVEVPFGGTGSYLSASGGTVSRSDTKSLKLRFVCRKVGESLVMVTLPIQKFKNVEFGFIKHCLEPQVYHESGFLQTAGSLLGAIFVLSICGGVGLWVYMRRRSQTVQKWTAVPTSDRVP